MGASCIQESPPAADSARSTGAPSKIDPDYASPPGVEPHPQTAEIIRQVEYYFSDENLIYDAHLLSMTGETGDGWVSLNEILGWKKMRQFKPPARAKASLHLSDKLEIWRNKKIRRREPLRVLPKVKPEADAKRERNQVLAEKPWMTKGMLKPTGFEAAHTEGPLKPEEAEQEGKLFDPEMFFPQRILNAVARYESKRKMHQKNRHILTRFLSYGAFKTGPHQFGGGKGDKALEDYDKDEIALIRSQFDIPHFVWDSFDPDDPSAAWIVDFETYAKAFLSFEFMATADNWRSDVEVKETTSLMRNFYNYLLYHDVCPEYAGQIERAKLVCYMAEEEFPKLARFEDGLRGGGFNAACSVLHGGFHKENQPFDLNAAWVTEHDVNYMSDETARKIFMAGIAAHCSFEEVSEIAHAIKNKEHAPVTFAEEMGLEILSVDFASGSAKDVYSRAEMAHFRPTGKLHCRRWRISTAAPEDLPKEVIEERKAKTDEIYTFVMEEDVLHACVPGMKVEATIKQLQTGLRWIDQFTYVWPDFYTYTLNEKMRDYKEPGEPKDWMKNQMGTKSAQFEHDKEVVRAAADDDMDPD